MSDGLDVEYQQRFTEGLLGVIMEISIVESADGQRTAMVQAGEVIDAMITMTAMLSATSTETASPTKTRATCEAWARRLQRRITEAQRQPMPFKTVHPGPTQ